MTNIADALVNISCELGYRVVLQHGWGDLDDLPKRIRFRTSVFYVGQPNEREELTELLSAGRASIGALDHEWLFPQCKAVCHHGGCGTTQCSIRHECPALVIAFFGDQPLWGGLLQHHGAGRLVLARQAQQIPALRSAFQYVVSDEAKRGALEVSAALKKEQENGAGLGWGVEAFHKQLPTVLLQCDVCCRHRQSNPSQAKRIRLAKFYDSRAALRLCEVCTYAAFLHGRCEAEASEGPEDLADHIEHLAVYRALDWGRTRRRWLRALGTSTVSAMEGVVTLPWVGLRSGGAIGFAVGGVAGLINLLVAPVTGVRFLARQVRTAPHRASGESDPSGNHIAQSLANLQDLQICGNGVDLWIDVQGAAKSLPPTEQAALCKDIHDAYHAAVEFHCRVSSMQDVGHRGFAKALEKADGNMAASRSRASSLRAGSNEELLMSEA